MLEIEGKKFRACEYFGGKIFKQDWTADQTFSHSAGDCHARTACVFLLQIVSKFHGEKFLSSDFHTQKKLYFT